MKNRHVYQRAGLNLRFITTVMSTSAEDACEKGVPEIGKYVVTDANFTEIEQVYVTFKAEAR